MGRWVSGNSCLKCFVMIETGIVCGELRQRSDLKPYYSSIHARSSEIKIFLLINWCQMQVVNNTRLIFMQCLTLKPRVCQPTPDPLTQWIHQRKDFSPGSIHATPMHAKSKIYCCATFNSSAIVYNCTSVWMSWGSSTNIYFCQSHFPSSN